jgi:hypothetical protein
MTVFSSHYVKIANRWSANTSSGDFKICPKIDIAIFFKKHFT